MNWAHSLYLEQLAERGAVGLLALVLLIAKPVLAAIRSVNDPGLLDKSLLASVAALLLAGVAEASLLRIWVMALIFLLLALFETVNRSPQPLPATGED